MQKQKLPFGRMAGCHTLVEETERAAGIKNFGIYIRRLLTVDALFLNEDRHKHNIAVLLRMKIFIAVRFLIW